MRRSQSISGARPELTIPGPRSRPRRSSFRVRSAAWRCARSTAPPARPGSGRWPARSIELVVESELLAGNPLGDPARRPLYVYRSPGVELGAPRAVACRLRDPGLHRAGRHVARAHARSSRRSIERLDAMFAAGDCPDAIVVFVDAWTSLGGSQFLNSTQHRAATWTTCATRSCRSSTSATRRWPAATTAGWPASRPAATARWSCRCCAPTCSARSPRTPATRCSSAATCATSRRSPGRCATTSTAPTRCSSSGSRRPTTSTGRASASRSRCTATRARTRRIPTGPGEALLPFEIATGRLIDDVWELWLEHDPVRMAPRHADALRSMRRIYLDAGRGDEYFLDLGAQAFAAGAREARRRAHARAVRRQARRHRLPLPGRDPRAVSR